MPNSKTQEFIFTVVMATFMVYGMIVYNIILSSGGLMSGSVFVMALAEMRFMVPIAIVLEFFVVGKIAKMMAFSVVTPQSKPLVITCAISISICLVMCPLMSLIAMVLFNEPSFMTWLKLWICNLPMAMAWQLLVCGPLVRFMFKPLFRRSAVKTAAKSAA